MRWHSLWLLGIAASLGGLSAGQEHQHVLPRSDGVVLDPNEPSSDTPFFTHFGRTGKDGRSVWEYRLVVTEQQIRLADGTMYKVWAYGNRVPGPALRAREGDRVRVTLVNETSANHTIHFHGVFVPLEMDGVPPWSPVVKPGESFTYDFIARPAGTHFYHCHVDSNEHLNRGMSGAFIITPRTPEPHLDHDLLLILGEWNSRYAQSGHPGNPREVHDSDFFTINGRSFPETAPIVLHAGDVARLRIINAGAQEHSIHLHGQRFLVTHKDGVPLTDPRPMDTVPVAPGERVDIVVLASTVGEWPLHCHVAAHQTNGGVYPGGMMTHLRVVPSKPGAIIAGGQIVGMTALRRLWRSSAERQMR